MHFRSLRFLSVSYSTGLRSVATPLDLCVGKYLMARIREPKRRSPFSALPGNTHSHDVGNPCQFRGCCIWYTSDAEILERCLEKISMPWGSILTGVS